MVGCEGTVGGPGAHATELEATLEGPEPLAGGPVKGRGREGARDGGITRRGQGMKTGRAGPGHLVIPYRGEAATGTALLH